MLAFGDDYIVVPLVICRSFPRPLPHFCELCVSKCRPLISFDSSKYKQVNELSNLYPSHETRGSGPGMQSPAVAHVSNVHSAQTIKHLRKGVREVQKFIRKGEKGIVLLAGDTNPIEVICHMPILCEDNQLPYCYLPSKEDLGAACGSKRPTCTLMVRPHNNYKELYDECFEDVKSLPLPI